MKLLTLAMLLCALMTASIQGAKANETSYVHICVTTPLNPDRCVEATVEVQVDGFPKEVSIRRRTDNSYFIDLETCNESVIIHAKAGRLYAGRMSCSAEPRPLIVLVQYVQQRIAELISISSTSPSLALFDRDSLTESLVIFSKVITGISERARKTQEELFAALDAEDFPTAQKLANEMASILRQSGYRDESHAYSTLAFLTGFRAIGLEPLSADNPLLTTVGSPARSFLVLSPAGKSMVEYYQNARGIDGNPGVWDFKFSRVVSDIDPGLHVNAVAPPRNLDFSNIMVAPSGRIILN